MTDTLLQSPATGAATSSTTSQYAVGRVTIAVMPGYDMMLWTLAAAPYTLCMGQRTPSSGTFTRDETVISGFASSLSDSSQARYQNGLVNGPSFVPGPNLTEGYVVCVNQDATVIALPAKVVQVAGDPDYWCLEDGWRTVTGSKAAGAPAAALGLQNGQLVLNIVWQDAGADGMVLAQMEVGNAQATLSFKPLGQACIGQPSLVMSGGRSFLAWTGTDGAFNLAIDPAGGVDFRFDGHLIDSSRSSMWGPCLVPMGGNQMYVLWATSKAGIQYAQLAEDQFGQWVFNPAPGCSGMVPGSGIALGGPYGLRYDQVGANGQTVPALAVAWPDRTGLVQLVQVPVSLAPVPIRQTPV